MSMLFPKPDKPPRPPSPPTKADASVQFAGQEINTGYSSLVNTGPQGLQKKASTSKRSLVGGAS